MSAILSPPAHPAERREPVLLGASHNELSPPHQPDGDKGLGTDFRRYERSVGMVIMFRKIRVCNG